SFDEIYNVRDAASDLATGAVSNYSLMWFYGAINPFLVASGLYFRRWWLFMIGSLGQLLVYASFGTKASLLSIVFIVGIYLLFRIGHLPFALKFIWAVVALFASLCLAYSHSADDPSLVLVSLLFLVFFRTFGLAGLLTGQYLYFIQHNPLTF